MLLGILIQLGLLLDSYNLPKTKAILARLILGVAFEAPKLAWLKWLPLVLAFVCMGILSKYGVRLTLPQRIFLIIALLALSIIIKTFGIF